MFLNFWFSLWADIHFHFEEWDPLLDEGNWEPEQISDKLPAFLNFLRQVQSSVFVSHSWL